MTTYTKAFFGVAEDENFNLAAAVDAYEWVMAHPDEAPFVVSKALFDKTTTLMEYYREPIAEVTRAYVSKRLNDAKRGLSRSVSKSESAARAMEVIETVSKAAGDNIYDEFERRQNAERQLRDARGQFRVMNRVISHTTPKKAWSQRDAKKMGLPTPALPEEKRAAYQHDYQQVSQALSEALQIPGSMVQAFYTDGTTSGAMPAQLAYDKTVTDTAVTHGLVNSEDYRKGVRVARIEAVAPTQGNGSTMGYDALSGFSTGLADFARETYGAGMNAAPGFASDWLQNKDPRTAEQTWQRLEASSRLANDIGGKYLPENAQLALKVGEWAGKYAPQAEKVIGPTARRSAYRYRGTEKTPSPVFQNEIDRMRRKYPSGRAARDAVIYGDTVEMPRNLKNPAAGVVREQVESKTIAYLKKQLPDAERYELNRKAGTIPPSQGIIIDRSGKVVTEAVGYGEDWYLPFNLKNLSKLKGGEYIRTRAFGGPTTEDIYVGLVSGARAVTVVSHSGTFTIEFDDTFRGSRRYNDKAGRMHARYAQLLDAVKSEDVSLGNIPGARMDELKAQASLVADPDTQPDEYATEMQRLMVKERKNPVLADALKDEVRTQVLNEYVQDAGVANDWATYSQQMEAAGNPVSDSPTQAIHDLGLDSKASRRIEAEKAKYAESMNPLRLNGRGYDQAAKALKDQFPYYIADVKFTPSGVGGKDQGYIKPKFIRPEGALEGFYDRTINGQEKFSADRTNYQNYPVMQHAAKPGEKKIDSGEYTSAEDRLREKGKTAGSSVGAPSAPENKEAAKDLGVDATMALIEALRSQTNFGAQSRAPGAPIGPRERAEVLEATSGQSAQGYAPVFTGSLSSVRSKLYAGGPEALAIKVALKKIKADKTFDIADSLWDNFENDGKQTTLDEPDDTMQMLAGIGNQNYKFPQLEPGQAPERYTAQIDQLLKHPLIAGNLGEGITADSSFADVMKVVEPRVDHLRSEQRMRSQYGTGQRIPVPITQVLPAEAIKNEARLLARVTQAFRLREDSQRKIAELNRANEPEIERVEINVGSPEEAERAEERIRSGKAEAPEEGADPAEQIAAQVKPLQDQIRGMVGMKDVAAEVDDLVNAAIDIKRREALGMPVGDRRMHLVLTGNPGTGKSTIARQLAPLYHQLGLTQNDTFKEYTRKDLIGGVLGETAQKTQAAFDDAKGGVMFIDEAYALKNSPQDMYGQEAIDTLLTNIENNKNDTVVILAGYPNEMNTFMNHNAGMRSRFAKTITFRDYTAPEMKKIADSMISNGGYQATKPVTRNLISNAVGQIAAKPDHANGRDVENFYHSIVKAQQSRLRSVKSPSRTQLEEIQPRDVRKAMSAIGLEPARKKAA